MENNNSITLNDYQILIQDQHGFMLLADALKFINVESGNIINDLENGCANDKPECINRIIQNKETYYSLDVIILTALDYDYKKAFELYESAIKKELVFTNYVTDTIIKEKETLIQLNQIVSNNINLIKTFDKYEKVGDEENSFGNPGFISLESLNMLIGLLKEKGNFDKDFGVIIDYQTLLDILYFTGVNNEPDPIEFGDDDAAYVVKTMYDIIKKKPFASGNEVIAAFIAYYYLYQSSLIEEEGSRITTSEDICLAIGLIINSTDDNALENLNKANSLLAKHYISEYDQSNCKLNDILDTSKEGIINYIISSIERFYGYQGYYDFYKGRSCVYKIHYHGRYNGFVLDKAKTFLEDNALVFKGNLYCFSEAPNDLINRDSFLKDIVEEIQYRSYKDVIKPFLSKLKNKVKPYFDLDSIEIKFDFNIKTKFEEDYEW